MRDRVYTGSIPLVRAPGDEPAARPLPADPPGGIAKPLLLLADSQPLFWAHRGELFLERLRERIESEHPRAAYLGASNGDDPDYYALFVGAMSGVGITRCRHVPAAPTEDDLRFLEEADLVLLSGGDVARGWKAFVETGVRDLLLRRYFEGAVLVGVSAGAVQLGLVGWPADEPTREAAFPTLGLVPYVVAAHDEEDDWQALRGYLAAREGAVRGLGIPRGGGLLYHPDHTAEPVRHPACELVFRDGRVTASYLFPPADRV